MKLKIVNKKKFIKRAVLVLIVLLFAILNANNRSSSEGIQQYKTITVNSGDTLWSIAQYEQNENEYYKNTDIREIVYSIKTTNNLSSSSLTVNQNLKIPVKS